MKFNKLIPAVLFPTWRETGVTIAAFMLCFYFAYHLIHGERGYFALKGVEQKRADSRARHAAIIAERAALETRVRQLRPNSLDLDLLDERARHVLGFVRPEERVVIETF
jgi:cell division protein FtsB